MVVVDFHYGEGYLKVRSKARYFAEGSSTSASTLGKVRAISMAGTASGQVQGPVDFLGTA